MVKGVYPISGQGYPVSGWGEGVGYSIPGSTPFMAGVWDLGPITGVPPRNDMGPVEVL